MVYMTPATYALALGVFSGISMPIGAVLGMVFAPVSAQTCGEFMAFGAGALIFAVTVAIFGHALDDYENGTLSDEFQDWVIVAAAIPGAYFYLYVLEKLEASEHGGSGSGDAESQLALETHPLMRSASSGQADWAPGSWEPVVFTQATKSGATLRAASVTWESQYEEEHTIGKDDKKTKDYAVAVSLFLGLLIDGVPEGVFMGFQAAEGKLSLSLVFSLLIANFPEAFAAASLLHAAGMGPKKIFSMWMGLCLLTGSLCGVSCAVLMHMYPNIRTRAQLPHNASLFIGVMDGFTGGAMLACISAVMLPEAMHRTSKASVARSGGFLTVLGFLFSMSLELYTVRGSAMA